MSPSQVTGRVLTISLAGISRASTRAATSKITMSPNPSFNTLLQRSPSSSSHFFSSSSRVSRVPLLSSHRLATNIQKTAPVSCFHTSSLVNADQDANNDTKKHHQRPETRPCWKCSTPVPFLALQCSNPDCKVVQTIASGANFYEVLGLGPDPTFDIDVKDLRIKFFKIQQLIHPDSYSQNTNGDQVYAQQQSSLTNKAYATLKEPLSRANYMLNLLGDPIHETESLNEPELLMEVMEARELLEEAQTEEEVDDLKNANDARIKDAVGGLSRAFKEQDLERAKTLAIELQYWIRIQNVIRDWVAGKPIVADHV
ncbi:hypothetical protein BGZ50_005438 [Haplosporangium sp. Z 11]|nr:hypothetical protein BGZ50_005438 [Haplosporangium sp. Z 11]